jgi:hypothetical protein
LATRSAARPFNSISGKSFSAENWASIGCTALHTTPPAKDDKSEEKMSDTTTPCFDPLTLVAALQRIADGDDDPAKAVATTLELLTDRKDAPRLMTDKQLRRLENVLSHHGKTYKRLVLAIGEAFIGEIEANGLPIRNAYLRPKAWFEPKTRMMAAAIPENP